MEYPTSVCRATFPLLLAFAGILPAATLPEGAYARLDPDRCVIGNGALERIVRLTDSLQTLAFRNKLAGTDIAVGGSEFALRLDETRLLGAADFALRDKQVKDFGQGGKQVVLTLASEKDGLEVQLIYEVMSAEPSLRKRLAVRATGERAPLLNAVDVESFTTAVPCELGGQGQPVFIAGSVFVGLEYPAASNEAVDRSKANPPGTGFLVSLRHRPGKLLSRDFLSSKTAVLGVGREGAVELAFADYLRRIRVPPRTFVHYNSWYDIRQDKMSTALFLETFASFKKNLCDPYGVRLDSFVPDDGWQDRSSLWEVNPKLFPDGLDALAAGLRAGGSCLGLWHPLTAVKGNLSMEWCRQQGYETDRSGSHLCLSAPKHNAQLRAVMTRHVKDCGINYFKHDFNSFACDGEGHGHLPRAEYGFEANVDAYIELLKLFRQLHPAIFLNCTGGMWLSPWWLQYCDTVWRGGSDTGYEPAYPFVDQRQQAISYVDGVLWDDFVKHRYQFPISALMVHGIVYGQLHLLGGREEPLESWADNAVWSMSLGLMMKELYLTPSLLSEAHWDILAKALLWAEANQHTLVETRMIGGNPHAGDVVGYKHAVGSRTIVYLRNPALRPQRVTFDLAPPEGERTPRVVEVAYPYRRLLAQDAAPDAPLSLELSPYEMLVVEAFPAAEHRRPLLAGCRYAVVSQAEREFVYEVSGAGGQEVPVAVVAAGKVSEVLIDGVPQPLPAGRPTFTVAFPAAPGPLQAEDASGTAAPLQNVVKVRLAQGSTAGRFSLICEKTSRPLPLGKITVNGAEAKSRLLQGDRWRALVVPLASSDSEVAWSVQVNARPKVPFAAPTFDMSAVAFARRPLAARRVTIRLADSVGAPAALLPTPFAAQAADFARIQAPHEVSATPPGGFAKISAADLKTIKGARLHVAVFGANSEERYRHKPVTLNGVEVGILPTNNPHRLDQWEEKTLDIPPDQWGILAARNVVAVAGCGGDCFKITDLALAVQLPDGTWAESTHDATIYCGVGPGWLHFEGTPFVGNRSPDVSLMLPVE